MSILFGEKATYLIIMTHVQSKSVLGKSKTGKVPWSSNSQTGNWSACQHIFWGVFIPDSKKLLLNSSQGSFQKGLEEVSLVENREMERSRSKNLSLKLSK